MEGNKFIQSQYGLNKSALDAFSDKVARPSHLIWWVDREAELIQWLNTIKRATETEKNYYSIIIGSYGRGKTLSLLKITAEAEKYPTVVPVFINFKSEDKSSPGLDLIFRIIRGINFYEIVKTKKPSELKEVIDSLSNAIPEPKRILNAIYFGSLSGNQVTMFSDISTTGKNSLSELALNFIKGNSKPTTTELSKLGVARKIDSVEVAKEYLASILYFLRKVGYTTLLVAIDEVESLFSLVTKSQQATYIALLRSLYDFPMGTPLSNERVANLVFFIGISEAGWANLQDIENKESSVGGPTVPLMDRIDSKTVLTVLSLAQTKELIQKRLRFNRADGEFEEKPLIPFTEDFVEYIHNLTNGEPRQILVRCGHVLDAGIAEKVKNLNKQFAKKVLEERM